MSGQRPSNNVHEQQKWWENTITLFTYHSILLMRVRISFWYLHILAFWIFWLYSAATVCPVTGIQWQYWDVAVCRCLKVSVGVCRCLQVSAGVWRCLQVSAGEEITRDNTLTRPASQLLTNIKPRFLLTWPLTCSLTCSLSILTFNNWFYDG